MAMLPDSMRFTPEEQAELDAIKAKAKVRHEKARKAAAKRGRKDFPMLPCECSAAFEHEFMRGLNKSVGPDLVPIIFENAERLRTFKAEAPGLCMMEKDEREQNWRRYLEWWEENKPAR